MKPFENIQARGAPVDVDLGAGFIAALRVALAAVVIGANVPADITGGYAEAGSEMPALGSYSVVSTFALPAPCRLSFLGRTERGLPCHDLWLVAFVGAPLCRALGFGILVRHPITE